MDEWWWHANRARPTRMYRMAARTLDRRHLYLLGVQAYSLLRPDRAGGDAAAALAALIRYADGEADESEFAAVRGRPPAADDPELSLLFGLELAAGVERLVALFNGLPGTDGETQWRLCDIFREIVVNPFRPWKAIPEAMGGGLVQPDGATVFPSPTARAVALGIAAEQAFDRLPVLADALEDCGVTDLELLAHCRRPGGHLRGCWAVDVVLGRT